MILFVQGLLLNTVKKWLFRLLVPPLLLGAVAAGGVVWWINTPMSLDLPAGAKLVDLRILPGTPAQRVVRDAVAAGIQEPAWLLQLGLRLSGQGHLIQAGSYEITPDTSPLKLLDKLVRGDQALRSVTLVEGWTFAQVRRALQNAEHLEQQSQAMDADTLMNTIGHGGQQPEGRFFPDTYVYPKHSSDVEVLRQAAVAMDKKLAQAWEKRHPGLPLKSPDEALILASIIEKETGLDSDRPQVSGVFSNRLRIGMRLQTDPTVAYGAGPEFDGRLRRIHLTTDTPYNTYTRAGLPPTPIAMPGWASLLAAVQPAQTAAIYFVARGDGSSHFSATLDQHNQAVRRYILNKP